MLTHPELAALNRALSGKRVLSVYLDGSASDPAMQRSWRVQLDQSLADLRHWLEDSSHAERAEFERCVQWLGGALAEFDAGIGAPGWAAFITAEGIHHAHPLPAPAPTLAVWSTGPCIAPYVRALKEHRSVVAVIVDARRATLYRYRRGVLDHVDVVRAHHGVGQPQHMGTPARQGFHTGTRGNTGRDAAQRSQLQGRERMIADAVVRVQELAGTEGWILVGGIKRVAVRVTQSLSAIAPDRVAQVGSLDVHAAESDIARIARAGASELRDAADERRLVGLLEQAGAHALGVAGPADVFAALERSAVRELYVTRGYLEDHAADAERAIRAALEQDAYVEEVSGAGAERLNRHGGMAAGLRFRSAPVEHAGTDVPTHAAAHER